VRAASFATAAPLRALLTPLRTPRLPRRVIEVRAVARRARIACGNSLTLPRALRRPGLRSRFAR
jgi:hypothetical protein